MSGDVVPFGKYKGQPIEVMAQDKPYCEWLAAQAWFRSQFGGIHTIIVNNFGKPTDTPEHNALQAKFTDDAWLREYIGFCLGGWTAVGKSYSERKRKAVKGYREQSYGHLCEINPEKKEIERQAREEKIKLFEAAGWSWWRKVEFESEGADVSLFAGFLIDIPNDYSSPFYRQRDFLSLNQRIECKPSVGDDYPAILRQMKKHSSDTLLIGEGGFAAAGATFEQVKKIFAASRITIVLLSEI